MITAKEEKNSKKTAPLSIECSNSQQRETRDTNKLITHACTVGCDRAINYRGESYGRDLSKLTLLYLRLSGLSSGFCGCLGVGTLEAGSGRTIYRTAKKLKERTS